MSRPKLARCRESPEFIREVYQTILRYSRLNWGQLRFCPDCVEYRNSGRCTHCGIGTWSLEDTKEVAKSRGIRLICETGVMFQ